MEIEKRHMRKNGTEKERRKGEKRRADRGAKAFLTFVSLRHPPPLFFHFVLGEKSSLLAQRKFFFET